MENAHITPEQLAYLNENLDIVDEYVRDFLPDDLLYGEPVSRVIYGFNTAQSITRYDTYIILVSTNNWTSQHWQPLLEYVKKHGICPSNS